MDALAAQHPALSRRYRLIVANLPGLGDSDEAPRPHTPGGLAAIAADGIARILAPGERFHLAGFSFGGLIGGHVAAALGERCRSLTLVGAGGLGLKRNAIQPLNPEADPHERHMSDRLLVATRKGLLMYQRRGSGWALARTVFAGAPVTAALSAADGTLYAALKHGHFGPKLHRSADGGETWQELPAPAFPADAADAPALFQIWTLETGGPHHRGRLWIGAIPAGLFRSDDGGASWQLSRALWDVPERARWFGGGYDDAGIHSVVARPARPGAAVRGDLLRRGVGLGDDGATWKLQGEGLVATYMPPEQAGSLEIQDPHRVARCAADPDVMWMQHHNGVFRSTDAGVHWKQLAPPVTGFGFAVAAHPKDPLSAWLVPAVADEQRIPSEGALCVTHTSDGGESWETFREGLPQRDAFDLVYRHGLDVDREGARLAMGSTTGALWVSDTAGARWQLINAHLPPIYGVRFA